MVDRRWRGDAPAVCQKTRVTFSNVESSDVFRLTIGNKTIEVTAAGNSAADVIAQFVTAIGASATTEWQEVVATAGTDEDDPYAPVTHLLLTAATCGVPFSVTSESDTEKIVIEETVAGVQATNEVQKVELVGTYTAGTWQAIVDLGGGDETTAAINYDATAADVRTALEGLPSISPGDVVVTGGPGPDSAWFVTWTGAFAASEVNPIRVDGTNLVGNGDVTVETTTPGTTKSDEIVQFTYEATAGTYTLSYGGETTSSIAYNASTSTIRSALQALPTIGGGNVQVYGGKSTAADRWSFWLVFSGDLAGTNVGDVGIDVSGLTYSALNSPGVIYSGGQSTRDEFQLVSAGAASSGTFKLTFDGQATTDLNFDAEALTVRTALEALSNLSAGDVEVRQPAWPGEWLVRFQGDKSNTDVAEMTMETGNLTGATSPGVTTLHPGGGDQNEVQEISVFGSGGTFTLTFDGQTTGSISYGATAATVETALEGLSNITDVTVTGTGTGEDPYVVTFVDPGPGDVAEMSGDASSLTGGGGGSTESVSHDPGTDEQQTITVTATGGTWTATFEGERSAAIPHDTTAATLQSALEAISTIGSGNVAVAGSTGGPWTVTFQGTLASTDVEMMTVDGSGLVGSSGTEAISITESVRSRGPNHWDDPLNWTPEGIPEEGDDVILAPADVAALYGIRQRSTFTADASTDELTMAELPAFRDGQKVQVISTGTLPAGLSASTDYYVRDLDRDTKTLKLAATEGGTAINVTDAGTGTHTIRPLLASLTVPQRFANELGLPDINESGETPYFEYRPKDLAIGVTNLNVGDGEGEGFGLVRVASGPDKSTVNITGEGRPASGDLPNIQWRGDHADNVLNVVKGSVAVAPRLGETATIKTLRVGFLDNPFGDSIVRCGEDVTLDGSGSSVEMSGGELTLDSATISVAMTAGILRLLSGTHSSLLIDGGECFYESTGAITDAKIGGGGRLDFSRNMRLRTVTDCQINAGGELNDPFETVTFTNPIRVHRTTIGEITLDLGTHFDLQRTKL
jgi:hypothetical protein